MMVLCIAVLLDLNGAFHTESTGKRNGFIRLERKGAETCCHAAQGVGLVPLDYWDRGFDFR